MARIVIDLEQVKRLSARLFACSEQVQTDDQRLSNGIASLDWEGADRIAIEEQIALLHARANQINAGAVALARSLATRAQAFETADRESAASLFPSGPGTTTGTTQGQVVNPPRRS